MGGERRGPRRALLINALELLRDTGATRTIEVDVPVATIGVDDPRLTGDVHVVVTLQSALDRLLADGELSAGYRDECSRCLTEICDRLVVTVSEQYTEGGSVDDPEAEDFLDSFPIEHGQLDLAPMVRESLLLGIPDMPLCRDDCAGLCPVCGANRNTAACDCDVTARDDRWAILDQLRDDP